MKKYLISLIIRETKQNCSEIPYHYLIPVQMVIIKKTKEAQLGDAHLNSHIWEVEVEEPGVQERLGYIASSRSTYTI